MARKAKVQPTINEVDDTMQPVVSDVIPENAATDKEASIITDKDVNEVSDHILLIDCGKALKLSPKTDKHVFYDISKNADNELFIRLSSNEGGGLHSREWLKFADIFETLETQRDKVFKSTLMKGLFQSNSANNTGFLCAVLRSHEIKLIQPAEGNLYLHELTPDYEECKQLVLALANAEPG